MAPLCCRTEGGSVVRADFLSAEVSGMLLTCALVLLMKIPILEISATSCLIGSIYFWTLCLGS